MNILNKIWNEDCIGEGIGLSRVADKSVDMILCDLPYGTTACKWDNVLPLERYFQANNKKLNKEQFYLHYFFNGHTKREADIIWEAESKPGLWEHYERVIKDNGAIVLTASQPFTTSLIMSNIKMFRYEWIWEKDYSTGFANAKKMPMKSHENILVFYKSLPTYNPQGVVRVNRIVKSSKKAGGGVLANNGFKGHGVYMQEFTNYPISIIGSCKESGLHPTQKPVALFEYLIKTYTNEGDLVVDNCAGSFTTAVACENTNRNWICIEQERKYCEIGRDRILANRKRLQDLKQAELQKAG